MRFLSLMLSACILAGCTTVESPRVAAPIVLEVSPRLVAPGDAVVLTLTNGTAAAIGYNLCPSALEQKGPEGWMTLPGERVCTMELRILNPGEQARYTMDLSPSLSSGEYRFARIESFASDTHLRVTSEHFRVSG